MLLGESEDSLPELVVSFYLVGLGIQPRSLGLAAGTFVRWASTSAHFIHFLSTWLGSSFSSVHGWMLHSSRVRWYWDRVCKDCVSWEGSGTNTKRVFRWPLLALFSPSALCHHNKHVCYSPQPSLWWLWIYVQWRGHFLLEPEEGCVSKRMISLVLTVSWQGKGGAPQVMEIEDDEYHMCVCVLDLCSLEGSLYTDLCLVLEVTFIFKMGCSSWWWSV